MDPYATLAVPLDADDAVIRAAYRRLAQKFHPDKGGELEDFRAVQKAYELIGTEDAREYYALNGAEAPTIGHVESEAFNLITGIFSKWLDEQFKGAFGYSDPIDHVRAVLNQELQSIGQAQVQLQNNLKKTGRLKGRFSAGAAEVNIFETRLEEVSRLTEQNLREVEKAADRTRTALALLTSFAYTPEEGMQAPIRTFYIGSGNTTATGW